MHQTYFFTNLKSTLEGRVLILLKKELTSLKTDQMLNFKLQRDTTKVMVHRKVEGSGTQLQSLPTKRMLTKSMNCF